jgi:hypothetical protein
MYARALASFVFASHKAALSADFTHVLGAEVIVPPGE